MYRYMPSVNLGLTLELNIAPSVKKFVVQALQNLADAHDAIIESHVNQTHQANHH